MSEHVTHIAVAEDSARVAFYDPDFSPIFRQCIERFPNAVRWGSTSRSGDTFILPMIEKWRDEWQDTAEQQEKLAYIIGWAGHLAGDRTFKPVFRITDLAYYVRGYPGPSHASVYHDAIMMHEVFDDGNRAPFHPNILNPMLKGHPAADVVPVNKIENAFAMSFGNDMAQFKKFLTGDRNKEQSFLENTDAEMQKFYVEMDRYTEAYCNPDLAMLRKYILNPNFYDRSDQIIQIAEQMKMGVMPDISLQDAIEASKEQSLYAQALALGHQFYMAASDFFHKKISKEEAMKKSRTFQAHKQQLSYYIEQAEKENTKQQ
ncbi:MAG: hypothetical protein HKN87_15980 [Saprospiraceae bacterium]|nr:hypothetical protein [Saprospiraceae bacterium]